MPSAVRLQRLFGGRASHARSPVEGRQPEPSSSVAGCGSRWNGPGGGGEDRRHGSPDAADSVHRFNTSGPEGLIDNRTEGPKPRLSEEQLAQFAKIVDAGPDREKDGIVRWRPSISSVSLPKGSASTFIRAMSESS